MQIPLTPPDIQALLRSTPPDRLTAALMAVRETEDYWHWDELKHRQPPSGLAPEEWWLALKLGRLGRSRSTALKDLHQRSFSYFTTDPMLAILHDVDMRAGGSVRMSEQVTNPDTRDQYHVSSLMEEAITSSQLEGAATTREVARDMLRSSRPPGT
ncbi:MAG: hypothetical protein ACOYMN_14595 [Roseimicrobium sp.]